MSESQQELNIDFHAGLIIPAAVKIMTCEKYVELLAVLRSAKVKEYKSVLPKIH